MSIDSNRNKDIARAKSKRPLNNLDDLASQLDALQRAFAHKRGIDERFQNEMRAKMRVLLERMAY